MNRLLKAQLKKVYGKEFSMDTQDNKFKKLLELVDQGYSDLYSEIDMIDTTLEVNSLELTELNHEIMKSNKLIRSVTNSVSDVIFYKDLDFQYIGCNLNFEELTGKSEQEIVGKDDYDLFDKEYADLFRTMDKDMLKSSKENINKEWVKYPDGRDVYFLTTKSPLLDANAKQIGIVGVSRDITKEYRLEKEIQDKQALLIEQSRSASMGEMIGNIAHQWRQPLNALGLVIQKIAFYQKRDMLDEARLEKSIEKSMSLIDGMSETIDDFRDFFNPKRVKDDFSLNHSIEIAYQIVESSLELNNIKCEHTYEKEFFINGFKNEFSQVILNLINNAKDALVENKVENPYINITVTEENESMVICVCDNGGGIKEDVIVKIFDPYFTTKDEGKGTGLGLHMSKMIIEDHMNGELSVNNTEDGAVFKIVI